MTEKPRVFDLVTGRAAPRPQPPAVRQPALPDGCLNVTQLSGRMKSALEAHGDVMVGGEVTGFKALARGHWNFELKDARSKIRVIVFFSAARRLTAPRDGDLVVLTAQPTFNGDFGIAQLVATSVMALGDGDQKKKLDALKAKLAEAGFFDLDTKRPLPLLPHTVGLVTSLQAAALRDVLKVIAARNHTTHVIIRDTRVQGDGAAADIADAIRALDAIGRCDVLLVVRGGGAREDLRAFDTEPVVRAIAACSVPVVCGVGHEIDISLADLAADVRAATPSQAAELAVPSKADLYHRVDSFQRRLRAQVKASLATQQHRLQRLESRLPSPTVLERRLSVRLIHLERRLGRQAPRARLQERAGAVDALAERLQRRDPRSRLAAAAARLSALQVRLDAAVVKSRDHAAARLDGAVASLDALSPLAVLRRGWALVTVVDDDARLARPDDLTVGARLHVRLAGAGATVVVDSVDDKTPTSETPS